MGTTGIILYLIVVFVAVRGFIPRLKQSKKSALIMAALSPVYLLIAQFIAPYSNSRGKFDVLFDIGRQLGFSDQGASNARVVFVFVVFWIIFFVLEFFTFKFLVKYEKVKIPGNSKIVENALENCTVSDALKRISKNEKLDFEIGVITQAINENNTEIKLSEFIARVINQSLESDFESNDFADAAKEIIENAILNENSI